MADHIRIMHVDDDPQFVDLAATYLEREDDRNEVLTATSPSEALDVLADRAIDCIISDYDMPRTNGIEFLETVRDAHPDLPFILFTGKGSEEVAAEAISAEVTDYLQKESGTDQYSVLANRIRNYVEGTRAEAEREYMRERMDLALAHTDSVIFEIDLDGGEVTRFGEFEHFFDHHPNEVPTWKAHLERAVHPEDRDEFREFYQALSAGERTEGVLEYRTAPDAGSVRWIRDKINVVGNAPNRALGIAQDVTEERERRQELQHAKRRLDLALEEARAGIWEWNLETDELYWSDQLLEILSLDEGTFGSDITAFEARLHPDDVDRVEAALDHAIETGEPYQVEQRIRNATDEYVWLDVRGQLVGEDSSVMIGIGIDITERKGRELHLESVIDNLPGYVYRHEFEPAYPLRFVKGDAQSVTGYTSTELSEDIRLAEEVIHPDDRDDIWEEIVQDIENTGRFDTRYRIISKDGQVRWVRDQGKTFEDPVTGDEVIDGFVTEVSEHVEREQELRRAKRRLDLALKEARAGIWEWNLETDELYWSDELLEMLDLDSENFGGNLDAFETRLHPDDVDRVQSAIERAMETGERYRVEQRLENDQGQYVWVDVRGQMIEATESLMIGIALDITERKEYEAELRQQRDRLEEFASVVSHDLRSPLGVASGRLELAMEDCESGQLEHIETALDRMDRIIEDVLWLARQGRNVGSIDTVHFQTTANTAWRMVAEDSELRHSFPEDGNLTIQADEDRLCQLLENLFRNAIEHGGENVSVTLEIVEDGFAIEDDGPGIPEDAREKVFEAGYSTTQEGTGFGLSIVHRIAEAHGWNVVVTEGAEGGARFEITGVEFGTE